MKDWGSSLEIESAHGSRHVVFVFAAPVEVVVLSGRRDGWAGGAGSARVGRARGRLLLLLQPRGRHCSGWKRRAARHLRGAAAVRRNSVASPQATTRYFGLPGLLSELNCAKILRQKIALVFTNEQHPSFTDEQTTEYKEHQI